MFLFVDFNIKDHTIVDEMIITKSFSFSVERKAPHVTRDPSGIWVSYYHYTYTDHVISLYDESGNFIRSVDVPFCIRRMTTDGKGHLYLASVDDQCVTSFDVATSNFKELAKFDGYPAGLAFSHEEDCLIVCENECPSYFVYESGNYARFQKLKLSTLEKTVQSCENCHECISNVAIGKNKNLWTADYINDTVYLMTSEGELISSFTGPADTLLNPLDISTDEQGRAFVICTALKCLYVLDDTCHCLISFDLGYMPCSVEVKGGRIWVGVMNESEIHVYTYKNTTEKL